MPVGEEEIAGLLAEPTAAGVSEDEVSQLLGESGQAAPSEADLPPNAFSQASVIPLRANSAVAGRPNPSNEDRRYEADLQAKAPRLQALMKGMNVTTQDGVDRHASILRLARETRMHYDTAAANFDEIERMHRLASVDPVMWMRANPDLTRLIFERPELAPTVMADHKVNALSRAWNWMQDHSLERTSLAPPEVRERAQADAALRDKPKQEALTEDEQAKSTRESSLMDMSGWEVFGGGLMVPKKMLVPGYRFTEAWAQQKISRSGYELLLARGRGDDEAAAGIEERISDQRVEAVRRNYGEGEAGLVFSSMATAAASTLYGLKEGGVTGGVAAAVVGAGTLAATKMPGASAEAALAAGSLFGKAGAVKGTFELEAGSAYLQLLETRDRDGGLLDERTARTAATIYGVLASGIEFASWGPMLKAMGPAGELIKTGEVKAITRALVANDAFKSALRRAGKHWLPSALAEGGEEGLQNAVEQAVTLLAQGYKPKEVPGNIKGQDIVESVGEGTIGGFGLGGASVAVGVWSGAMQRDRAIANGKVVSDILSLTDSPTVKAAPEVVAKLIENASARGGSPVASLYVDPQRFVRLFQTEGGDANQAIQNLMGEEGPKKLQEALANGTRLEVPTAEYIEKWGGSEAGQKLATDTSTSPTAPTLRDIAEFDKAVEEAAKDIEQEKAASEGEQSFIDAMEAQLAAVQDEGKGKARLQANIWRALVRTMQERLGTNADEFFRGLTVMVEQGDGSLTDVEGNPIFGQGILSQRAQQLSPEGRAEEFFRDKNTGLLNDEAWRAMPAVPGKPLVGHISVEGIKFLNDNTDHETADLLYRAVARALHQVDPQAAKVGGDFAVRVKDQAEFDAMLQLVREAMPEQLKGFEITGATGATYDEAGQKNGATNKARVAKGERADPRPPHPTLTNEYGEPEVMAPQQPKGFKGDLKSLAFPEDRARAEIPAELMKLVGDLKPADYFDKAYVDQKTGEWTARGWAALPRKAHVASLDVKGLRHANEVYGKEVGDAMLHRMGQWAKTLGGEQYDFAHLHGDEYAAQSDDPKALEAFVAELEAALAENPVMFEETEVIDEQTGKPKLTPVKVEFHYGYGERNLEAADRDLNDRKSRSKKARAAGLERRGNRSARPQDDGRAGGSSNAALGEQAPDAGQAQAVDPLEAGRSAIGRMRANKADAQAFLEYVEGKRERPNIKPALERLLGRYGIVDPLGYPFDENGRDLRQPMKGRGYVKQTGIGLVGNAADAWANRKSVPMSRAFFSGGEKGKTPRGYTGIDVTKEAQKLFKIALNPESNLSTFLHESGHVFLKLLAQTAAEEAAPKNLKDDWATALKWLGAESFEKLTVEQHEKWARGFEAYLLEGKAPSTKLEGAFSAFKLWLKGVYRSVASLNVELNDEIRGVFDRLLATDQELERQRNRMGLVTPMAQDILGMSPQEYAKYLGELDAATEHAALQAEHTAMREKLRETQKWWKEELKKERLKAADDYEQLPARIAEQTLKGKGEFTGQGKGGSIPLARERVIEMVGEKNAKRFITTKVEAEKTDPDELADVLGFPTGKAMLEGVLNLPEREAWVKAKAVEAMAEKHGDILEDRQRMAETVSKGLHGEMTAKWLAREAAALVTRVPGAAMVPDDTIRQAARTKVAALKLGKLDAGAALAAERKAANDAMKAAAKGDYGQALVAKNRQRLNMYMWRELTAAREMREEFLELAAKMGDRKARHELGKGHQLFLGGSDLLLESLQLKEPSPREKPLPSMGEVIGELMRFDTVGFDEQVLEGVLARAPLDHRSLTVDEMKNVLAALKNIKAAARDRATILIDGKRIAREDAKAKLKASAEANLPPNAPPPTPGAETPRQGAAGWWNALDGELRKPEFLFNRLGGRDTNSPWHQFIVRQIQQAKHLEADLMAKYGEPLLKAMRKLANGRSMELVDGAALFPTHTKKAAVPQRRFEILMMLLNAGNASNLERLTAGRGIDEAQLRAAATTIGVTKDEYDAIQEVIDSFEEIGRLSFDLEERDSGLRPEKIEAREFVTPHGTYRGGYFPAVYDMNVTNVGAKQEAAFIFDPGYVRPGTAKGHLQSRVQGFDDVISLSPKILTRHIAQVLHDLAYRERLKAVANLLLDDDVQGLLRTYLGTGKAAVIPQWLRDIGQMRGAETTRTPKLTGMMRWVRGNLMSVLGYSVQNALEDYATNLSTATIGTGLHVRHLAAGMQAVSVYDRTAMGEAEEKSGELRARREQIQRELLKRQAELTEYNLPGRKALRFYKDHAFALSEMADRATASMIWIAAERQYLEEHAEEENDEKRQRDAVTFADAMVRKVLVSHSPVDQSALMRDKGPVGAFLVFFGFFNHAYNRVADIADQAIDAKTSRARAEAIGAALGFMTAVFVIGSIVRGQGPGPGDEPEGENTPAMRRLLKARNYTMRKLLVGTLELFPFLGPLGQAGEAWFTGKKHQGARNNSIVGIFESVGKSYAKAIDEGKDPDERVKAAMKTLEPTLGIPVSQLVRTGGFLWDWYTGDVQPRGPGDVAGGIVHGQREGQGGNLGTMGQDLYEAVAQ
jgi:GGDEF domain-containing protein